MFRASKIGSKAMNRRNRCRLSAAILAGVVPLAMSLVAQGAGPPAAAAGSSLVQYREEAWPTPDLSSISDEARSDLRAASALVEYNKDDFAGTYVDGKARVAVVPSSNKGYELAAAKFGLNSRIVIERSTLSLNRASELGLSLFRSNDSLAAKIWQWAIEPNGSALRLGVFQTLTEGDQAEIGRFAAENNLAINVYIDQRATRGELNNRLGDDSPYAGGFRYVGVSAGGTQILSCSGGFGYRIGTTDYMLSAGHCFDRGTIYDRMWNTYDGVCCTKKVYSGLRSNTTWNNGVGTVNAGSDSAKHGDLSLVDVSTASKAAGDQVWWGSVSTSNKIPVTERRVPTVGDWICINGIASGSDCGTTIQGTNINHVYSNNEILQNGDWATSSSTADCSQNGDSGGSVVLDHTGAETQATAIGIVSGSGIGWMCDQYFTGIEEARQAWSGDVKYH